MSFSLSLFITINQLFPRSQYVQCVRARRAGKHKQTANSNATEITIPSNCHAPRVCYQRSFQEHSSLTVFREHNVIAMETFHSPSLEARNADHRIFMTPVPNVSTLEYFIRWYVLLRLAELAIPASPRPLETACTRCTLLPARVSRLTRGPHNGPARIAFA